MFAPVLAAFPEATASRIRATYQGRALRPGGAPATAGGYLRHLLGGQQPCPSKTTLTADLNALRSKNRTGDSGPGKTSGNDVSAFGGTWHAVTTSGAAPASSPSSSGGYGY